MFTAAVENRGRWKHRRLWMPPCDVFSPKNHYTVIWMYASPSLTQE